MTEQETYELVAGIASQYAPSGWLKLEVRLAFMKEAGEAALHATTASGRSWYEAPAQAEYQVFKAFTNLRKQYAAAGHPWQEVLLTIEGTGRFNTQFKYGGVAAQQVLQADVPASGGSAA